MSQVDPRVVEWRRSLRRTGHIDVHGRWPWRSTRLAVDDEGVWITSGRLRIPWSDLVGAEVFRTRGVSMLLLVVSEEFHARWMEGHGWWVRAMWLVERMSRTGEPRLRVPGRLAVDLDAFARWLDGEIERRGRRARA
jgi:hypothetical protein